MTDDWFPGSVAPPEPDVEPEPEPEPEPTPAEVLGDRVADQMADEGEPLEEPEVYEQKVEDANGVEDVDLADGEEIIAQRFDENEGVLYVVTSAGRKIALDGATATTLLGPPPVE